MEKSSHGKKHILIISGGQVDYSWARKWMEGKQFDFVIAADSGLVHADRLGVKPDFLLGDYDSVDSDTLERYRKNTQTAVYPREKDYTDTHIALIRAIEAGAGEISVIGATGTRYDHAMTNIFIMKEALSAGVSCAIYDSHNKIYLADRSFAVAKASQYGRYLSFAPMTETVRLSLSGVKYPLSDYELKQGLSICQSNEVTDEIARVDIAQGILIVFEAID